MLDDYVVEQPPVYTGPPRPPGYVPPQRDPERPPVPVPTIPEFLAAAKEQYSFVPDRPKTEAEFKQAYAKAAKAAGLTREQAVRIYAFETGGNGEYDTQAGLTSNKNAKADLARDRLQPAAQHQLGEPARQARRQVSHDAERDRRKPGRDRPQGDGPQDRGAAEDDRVQPLGAERLERARQARQVHRGRQGHPCRDPRPRHRPDAANAEAARLGGVRQDARALRGRSPRSSSS